MLTLILIGVLVLVIGGCACVFWTARGDAPRWARGVAKVTEVAGELTRAASRNSRSSTRNDDGFTSSNSD
ncbi:hypothetical protein ACWD4G_12440 [Streptomyces sp. NPDC002643]